MNSFGRIFRISIFGESHGECVGITIDGCPAGLALSPEDLLPDLEGLLFSYNYSNPLMGRSCNQIRM